MSWLADASANRINKAYIQNFFDLSGNLKVRNDGDVVFDLSNSQLTMIDEKQIPGDSYSIASTGGITRVGERSDVTLNTDGSVMIVRHQLGYNSDGVRNGSFTVWENTSGSTWTQKGSLLEIAEADHGRFQGPLGHTFAFLGYISSDGNRILVAWGTDDTTTKRGLIQIFDYVNNDWEQVGSDIQGANNDQIRDGIMSRDGTTIAYGSNVADYVKFLQYDSTTSDWVVFSTLTNWESRQMKLSGNGTIRAELNYYSGSDYSLKVWKYENSSWSQLGQSLNSTESSTYFIPYHLNYDGNILVAGDKNSYSARGVVRVYQYNNGTSQWVQLGSDLNGLDIFPYREYKFPTQAEISDDGNVLIVSDYLALDETSTRIHNQGGYAVYAYIDNDWSQIYHAYGTYSNAQAGLGLSMSGDGTRFAWSSSANISPANTFSITRSSTTQPKTMTVEESKSVVNGTNWMNRGQSGASVASAYQGGLVIESSTTSSSDAVLYVETAGQTHAFSIRGDGVLYADNTLQYSSDDRIKVDEELITNATETMKKLSPQIYTKLSDLEQNGGIPIKTESGLIAQEVYYNAPELAYLVSIEDSKVGKIYEPYKYDLSGNDIQQDPDYSALGWGDKSASLDYIGLIPYLIKSNQEQDALIKERQNAIDEQAQLIQQFQERVTALENK